MVTPGKWAFVTLVFGLLGAGCETVPQQEFDAYTKAFDETVSVTEQLLLDMDAAEKISKKINASRNPPAAPATPYPVTVDLLAAASSVESQSAKRRRALDAVSQFNRVLTSLAAGKKPEEIRSSVDALISGLKNVASLFGATLPIPVPAGPIIASVIEKLEEASNREQFVAAIKEAEPIIDKVLQLFAKDAEKLYEIMARVANKTSKHQRDLVADFYIQLRDVAKAHKAPTGGLVAGHGKFEKKLGVVLKQVGLTEQRGYRSKFPIMPNGKDFDAITLSQLQQTLVQTEDAARKFTAVIEKQKAYHRLVVSYGHLLTKTRQTLKAVRAALDKPVDIRAQAIELTGFAFEVKRNWETLKEARNVAGGS